uniref:Protein kinase domain-containing protein n=1 Tax=Parascaris univalens TaxID=6257 RepID=A0A915CGD2_PARUN
MCSVLGPMVITRLSRGTRHLSHMFVPKMVYDFIRVFVVFFCCCCISYWSTFFFLHETVHCGRA